MYDAQNAQNVDPLILSMFLGIFRLYLSFYLGKPVNSTFSDSTA